MSGGRGSICLPADIATNDDIAAEDSTRGHVLVDRVRDDAGSHRELDRRGVDDSHHVARPRGGKEAEERPVVPILSVQLDHLLVIVGALEELNAGVEGRPSVLRRT